MGRTAGPAARTAVVATADDRHAVLAYNNSLGETIVAVNQTTAIGSFGNGFGLAIAGNTQSANGIGIAGATLPRAEALQICLAPREAWGKKQMGSWVHGC